MRFIHRSPPNSPFAQAAYAELAQLLALGPHHGGQLPVTAVTPGFFGVFSVAPVLGTGFGVGDFSPSGAQPALLNYSFWHNQLGAPPDIVGQKLSLGGHTFLVRGVLPSSFSLLDSGNHIFVPHLASAGDAGNTAITYARLRPSADLAATQLWLAAVAARHHYSLGGIPFPKFTFRAQSLVAAVLGPVQPWLNALLLVAFLILGLACASAATLLLAHNTAREKELATRMALGARGTRLAAQALGEGLVLALAGCALGLAAAPLGLDFARSFGLPAITRQLGHPLHAALAVSPALMGIALTAAIISAVLFGSLPVLRLLRLAPAPLLQSADGGWPLSARVRRWGGARWALVSLQIALAVAFCSLAGLLGLSLARQTSLNLGFEPQGLTALSLDSNPTAAQLPALLARVRAVPGVAAATVTGTLPFTKPLGIRTRLDYQTRAGAWAKSPVIRADAVSPGYFQTMGASLAAGRAFAPADGPHTARVAIVNAALARALWPGESAVGRQLRMGPHAFVTVVGLAPNIRNAIPQGGTPPAPEVYFPYAQQPGFVATGGLQLIYRATARAPAAPKSVAAAAASVMPAATVLATTPLGAALDASWLVPRFRSWFAWSLAALALLLALFGAYAVVANELSRRRREYGVRAALGAAPADLALLTTRRLAAATAWGALAGIIAALWLARLLHGLAALPVAIRLGPFAAAALFCLAAALALAALAALPLVRRPPADLLSRTL